MHEILRHLPADARVLDLGSAKGSFPPQATAALTVRLDREAATDVPPGTLFVRGDAAQLPFANRVFAAVISNHSLEHFDDFKRSLQEIGRVIAPDGSLFVAVPDASTFSDKLYRWLAKGGGHVNAFTSPDDLAATIQRVTGLPHIATKVLYSSLSFLNRRSSPGPAPRRVLLLGAGYEWSLFLYAWLSRRVDRSLKLRTSVYGWAFYFGNVPETIDISPWANVCIRCGAGAPASSLAARSRTFLPGCRVYACCNCGATNPFIND